MLQRHTLGRVPAKPHTALRDDDGQLLLETCITRDGFSGPFSMIYSRMSATDENAVEPYELPGFCPLEYPAEQHLRRRHVQSQQLTPAGDFLNGRRTLLVANNIHVGVCKPNTSAAPHYFMNGDGDELYFAKSGSGWIESLYGVLPFRELDYILIPRSTPYRLHLEGDHGTLLIMEGRPRLGIPSDYRNTWGQLSDFAPYSHRDFRAPTELVRYDPARHGQPPFEVIVKTGDALTRRSCPEFPLGIAGFDGALYPIAFNILDFQPKTGQVHLPPTVHTTFAGDGFVVCSFVPRVVDFHPEAIPCPYAHANVEMDEILYYVKGNFTSRKGIDSESFSLHPLGIAHGPHPGMYEKSIGSQRTNELAVMIDSYHPFRLTAAADRIEDKDYHTSWVR